MSIRPTPWKRAGNWTAMATQPLSHSPPPLPPPPTSEPHSLTEPQQSVVITQRRVFVVRIFWFIYLVYIVYERYKHPLLLLLYYYHYYPILIMVMTVVMMIIIIKWPTATEGDRIPVDDDELDNKMTTNKYRCVCCWSSRRLVWSCGNVCGHAHILCATELACGRWCTDSGVFLVSAQLVLGLRRQPVVSPFRVKRQSSLHMSKSRRNRIRTRHK